MTSDESQLTRAIDWSLVSSFSSSFAHVRTYFGTYRGIGVQMYVHTPVKPDAHYADPERFSDAAERLFSLFDAGEAHFETEEDLRSYVDSLPELDRYRIAKMQKGVVTS